MLIALSFSVLMDLDWAEIKLMDLVLVIIFLLIQSKSLSYNQLRTRVLFSQLNP